MSALSDFHPPTEEETLNVKKLQERLKAECPTEVNENTFRDVVVLRFFRGRKHIEEDAFQLLLRYAAWRKEFDVDNIFGVESMAKITTELSKNKFKIVEGAEPTGRPVSFVYVHHHDKNDRDLEEMRTYIIFALESLLSKAKPEEERMVITLDMSRFGMSCMDYDATKILIDILQTFYPETLQHFIFVDSPWIFSACWAVIKMWLDPVTAGKVVFTKKSGLHEYIKPECVPADFAAP